MTYSNKNSAHSIGNAVKDFILENQAGFSGWPGLSHSEIGANRVFKAPVVGPCQPGLYLIPSLQELGNSAPATQKNPLSFLRRNRSRRCSIGRQFTSWQASLSARRYICPECFGHA